MALLLTLLSVLALWLFLGVLGVGLLLVLKALESVRAYLEKIAMGVRAIEWQTAALAERVDMLAARLRASSAGLGRAAGRFEAVGRGVAAAAPALRARERD